jgi:hypothetical protein
LEHFGASVFHCPSCDGYEAKGRPVVAIGWSEQVVGFALELLGTRGDLRAIRLAGGGTVECQLGFFSIAHHPLTGLGEQLGCRQRRQRRRGLCPVGGERPQDPTAAPPDVDDRIQVTSTGR